MASLDLLPNELLLKIFSYFTVEELKNGIEDVCMKWHNIGRLKALTVQCQEDLVCLAERKSFKSLTSLEITTHIDFINRFIWGIGTLCISLKHLTIHNCNPLQESHIQYMSSNLRCLEHIDVFLSTGFVETYFITLMKHLKSIVLNNRILKSHLNKIAMECENLEALNMYGYVEYYPVRELEILMVTKYDKLKELTLRCSELTGKTFFIISNCHQLHSLKMYSCWLMTIESLMCFSKMEKLTVLHLTGLKIITKDNLLNFINNSRSNLKELNLSSTEFSDVHVRSVAIKFPELTTLELWKCRNLTESGVLFLINSMSRLRQLDLNMPLSCQLIMHISLSNVTQLRLLINDENRNFVKRIKDLVIIDCAARYRGRYFRGSNEGFRANLFYFSLRYKMLHPIKCDSEIKLEDLFDHIH